MALQPPPTVVVARVIRKTVPIYEEYVAGVDPTTGADIVEIRARVEAFLLTQNFKEGQPVVKGQLLFTLDSSSYQADLRSAKASRDKARADLEYAKSKVTVEMAEANLIAAKAQLSNAEVNSARLKPLVKEKAVPQRDYDNAVTEVLVAKASVAEKKAKYNNAVLNQRISIKKALAAIESAEAAINRANINISYCVIRSPMDGMAGERLVAPGNLVGRGEPTLLTQVTSLDPVRVNFNVSESDYLKLMEKFIKSGKKLMALPNLKLILGDGSTYPQRGRILAIEPVLDPKTATINVVGEFRNPDRLLRPGMFGRIRLVMDQEINAILIPQKAIMVLQSAKNVYVVSSKNKVELRSLQLGENVGKMVIINKGVKPGEKVIVEGQQKVRPDMEVKPVYRPVTTEPGGK
ncbi:MAG: efflux RND transporter periplasmic adaptor subunit [Candidatus Eremiobacteraeota bacterium]|nr:efflux RND transporter periplasmic adaptor subunit [Candidatus Eremiobacteraeota bacterium]